MIFIKVFRRLSSTAATSSTNAALVDVHTHLYLPRYMELLRSRASVPRVFFDKATDSDRLLILPSEDLERSTAKGRPVGSEYWQQPKAKHSFMSAHGIKISIVSLGNPWLDFLSEADGGGKMAALLNEDLESLCDKSNNEYRQGNYNKDNGYLKLFGFGVLPTGTSAEICLQEVERISKLDHIKGVIMGTNGLGKGLDDERLEPLFAKLAEKKLMIFLHPHYGITPSLFGERDNGHVLPLALGFPFETTIAVSRLILSGLFDRHPSLRILLAHSGGTIPFLAGRLDSCVDHDAHVRGRLAHPPSHYLKNLYYDAVSYHPAALAAAANLVGWNRLMFGTDHPFFPPLDDAAKGERWRSVDSNLEALEAAAGGDMAIINGVMGGNAIRELLGNAYA